MILSVTRPSDRILGSVEPAHDRISPPPRVRARAVLISGLSLAHPARQIGRGRNLQTPLSAHRPYPWPAAAHTRSPPCASGAAKGQVNGGAPGARTLNPRIKSPLLYH
jgi:hypothetical protein